jgi:hypothetical protein
MPDRCGRAGGGGGPTMQPPPLSQSQQLSQYDHSDSSRYDSRARDASRERVPASSVRLARPCACAYASPVDPGREAAAQRVPAPKVAPRPLTPAPARPRTARSQPGRRTGTAARTAGSPTPRVAWATHRGAWGPAAAATGQTRRTRSHATGPATVMTGGGEPACPCPRWASELHLKPRPASRRCRARGWERAVCVCDGQDARA